MPDTPRTRTALASPCSTRRNAPIIRSRSASRPVNGTPRESGDAWGGVVPLRAPASPSRSSSADDDGRRAGSHRQERHAQVVELRRHLRRQGARRGGHAAQLLGEHADERTGEGKHAGERLVDHHAHRVPVAGRSQGHVARGLLRRHVLRGPDDESVARLVGRSDVVREAEVEEHDALLRGHHDVRGLDVAVQLAGPVQGVETANQPHETGAKAHLVAARARARSCRLPARGDRAERAGRRGEGHRGGRPGRDRVGDREAGRRQRLSRGDARLAVAVEVLADDELHGEEGHPAVAHEIVEVDEVRVAEVRQRAKLALEPVEVLAIAGLERLQRDAVASMPVLRLVDDAHSALAEPANQLEPFVARELHPDAPLPARRRFARDDTLHRHGGPWGRRRR